jgi:hypothetical protein
MKTKKITIPSTQSEITLDQYQTLQQFAENETDAYKITIKMMEVLCGLTEEEVRSMNKSDFDDISITLSNTLNRKAVWQKEFTMNGVRYGFIPNLDDMTLGEYVDLDAFLKEDYSLHNVMTILYRPITGETIGGRYQIKPYTGEEDMELMKQAPLDAVNGALVFFYHLGKDLLKAIPTYLQKLEEKIIQSNPTSEVSGDGIVQSMHSQMENLVSLIEQLPEEFTSVSLFLHSKKKKQKQKHKSLEIDKKDE